MIVPTSSLYKLAYSRYAVGAYNINNLEQILGLFKGCIEENVATTKRVVERAHEKGISVEAELGRLGGVEEDVKVDEGSAFRTDPKEAVEFVMETGCDALAAAI